MKNWLRSTGEKIAKVFEGPAREDVTRMAFPVEPFGDNAKLKAVWDAELPLKNRAAIRYAMIATKNMALGAESTSQFYNELDPLNDMLKDAGLTPLTREDFGY
jgi:hypothetical protein